MATNFVGYWKRLCEANAAMRDDSTKVTISVKSLKAQLGKAYLQGAKDHGTTATESEVMGKVDDFLGRLREMAGLSK